MRKMILTGALILFDSGTAAQTVAALAVCVGWIMLVTNLNPFEEVLDDRLAQVEALQMLTTLIIGLVLQLQDASEDKALGERANIGYVLVLLNVIVIALAAVQQSFVRTIIMKVVNPIKMGCTICQLKREWMHVITADATDQDYAAQDRVSDDWYDASDGQLGLLVLRPLAMVVEPVDTPSWLLTRGLGHLGSDDSSVTLYFDRDGNPLDSNPVKVRGRLSETAKYGWVDVSSQRFFEEKPLALIPAKSFSTSTHWVSAITHKLLGAKPRLVGRKASAGRNPLFLTDPAPLLYRSRTTGELRDRNPVDVLKEELAGPKKKKKKPCSCLNKSSVVVDAAVLGDDGDGGIELQNRSRDGNPRRAALTAEDGCVASYSNPLGEQSATVEDRSVASHSNPLGEQSASARRRELRMSRKGRRNKLEVATRDELVIRDADDSY